MDVRCDDSECYECKICECVDLCVIRETMGFICKVGQSVSACMGLRAIKMGARVEIQLE